MDRVKAVAKGAFERWVVGGILEPSDNVMELTHTSCAVRSLVGVRRGRRVDARAERVCQTDPLATLSTRDD
jgi:hypothetical protein